MEGKKIGLFLGSFNPIHNGHLMIANYLAEFEDLDQVWFVISPLNPFKKESELLPDYHRRELVTKAVSDYPKFKVSTVEFQLPKPSFTIDTLSFLSNKYPDHQFRLIMGSDQLSDFHRWKSPERILDNYPVLVYPRPGFVPAMGSIITNPSVKFVEKAPMLEISSSFIRQSLKEGKDVRFFMPEKSWLYLDEMHFYK